MGTLRERDRLNCRAPTLWQRSRITSRLLSGSWGVAAGWLSTPQIASMFRCAATLPVQPNLLIKRIDRRKPADSSESIQSAGLDRQIVTRSPSHSVSRSEKSAGLVGQTG